LTELVHVALSQGKSKKKREQYQADTSLVTKRHIILDEICNAYMSMEYERPILMD